MRLDIVEQTFRDFMSALTNPLPEEQAGLIFGASVIAFDQAMRIFR